MKPIIFGILNVTEDSFSDGGKYLAADAALAHARAMPDADVLDIGAAASNPDAIPVPADTEIARLSAVVPALQKDGRAISIDSFSIEVQRWALSQNVDYLNDIQGFSDTSLYPELARSRAKLVVMHSVQRRGAATRVVVPPDEILERLTTFFDSRVGALTTSGIARDRLILDPGMGFFLGSNPEASFVVLRGLPALKTRFELPMFVSVSRKSFLRSATGRNVQEAGAATLAAELFAAHQGADYVRTHDPSALRDALAVIEKLDSR